MKKWDIAWILYDSLHSITLYSYGFLFNCTTVDQALDSNFHQWVSAGYLSKPGPTVAQL